MPLLSDSTKHFCIASALTFVLPPRLLCYCHRKHFVFTARSIVLWVGLDSNERVFRNLVYSQAASTACLPTHKAIESFDFDYFNKFLKSVLVKTRLWQSTSKNTSLATERLGASSRQSKCALRCSGCENASSHVKMTRCDDKFGRTRMEPGNCGSLTVPDIFGTERFFGF